MTKPFSDGHYFHEKKVSVSVVIIAKTNEKEFIRDYDNGTKKEIISEQQYEEILKEQYISKLN